MQDLTEKIVAVYKEKGLNGVHHFLKRNKIEYRQDWIEFGLSTNSKAIKEKISWIEEKPLRFHYYSRGVTSARTRWNYNVIRGTEIVLI